MEYFKQQSQNFKKYLLNHLVSVIEIQEKKILKIHILAADRHDKPICIGTDPMKGTYRRNYGGDYICREEEVRGMFADQQDTSYDANVVEELRIDALNGDTLKGYRIRFEHLNVTHPWNRLPNDEFLLKLTAILKNNYGELSPTIAGILMFGDADKIIKVLPNYFLDYREENDDKMYAGYLELHLMMAIGVVICMIFPIKLLIELMMT